MPLVTLARLHAANQLMNARKRALNYLPFSPAWDAAMQGVDESERRVWLLDRDLGQDWRTSARSDGGPVQGG